MTTDFSPVGASSDSITAQIEALSSRRIEFSVRTDRWSNIMSVMNAIANHVDGPKRVRISQEIISADSGLSVRTVHRCIDQAVSLGMLDRQEERGSNGLVTACSYWFGSLVTKVEAAGKAVRSAVRKVHGRFRGFDPKFLDRSKDQVIVNAPSQSDPEFEGTGMTIDGRDLKDAPRAKKPRRDRSRFRRAVDGPLDSATRQIRELKSLGQIHELIAKAQKVETPKPVKPAPIQAEANLDPLQALSEVPSESFGRIVKREAAPVADIPLKKRVPVRVSASTAEPVIAESAPVVLRKRPAGARIVQDQAPSFDVDSWLDGLATA